MAKMVRLQGREHYTKQLDKDYTVEVRWTSWSTWELTFYRNGAMVVPVPRSSFLCVTVYARDAINPTIKAAWALLKAQFEYEKAIRMPSMDGGQHGSGDPAFTVK